MIRQICSAGRGLQPRPQCSYILCRTGFATPSGKNICQAKVHISVILKHPDGVANPVRQKGVANDLDISATMRPSLLQTPSGKKGLQTPSGKNICPAKTAICIRLNFFLKLKVRMVNG